MTVAENAPGHRRWWWLQVSQVGQERLIDLAFVIFLFGKETEGYLHVTNPFQLDTCTMEEDLIIITSLCCGGGLTGCVGIRNRGWK